MGIVTHGIPADITLELAKIAGANAFIETGTFQGNTTRWAAKHFATVHTIERAVGLYEAHHTELEKLPGVHPHLGDSRTVLATIAPTLGEAPAVHWLDGHFSAGETAGVHDECPLMGELAALADRPQDLILIDDARLFLCAPPLPHRASDWPTMTEIVMALSKHKPFVQVVDDVIFVVPDRPELRAALTAYSQRRGEVFWKNWSAMHGGGVVGKLKRVLGS